MYLAHHACVTPDWTIKHMHNSSLQVFSWEFPVHLIRHDHVCSCTILSHTYTPTHSDIQEGSVLSLAHLCMKVRSIELHKPSQVLSNCAKLDHNKGWDNHLFQVFFVCLRWYRLHSQLHQKVGLYNLLCKVSFPSAGGCYKWLHPSYGCLLWG